MCCNKKRTKRILGLISILLISMLSLDVFASSNTSSHDHSKMDHSKMKDTNKTKLSKDAKESVLNALKVNEDLHQVFFDYDAKLVEENAAALREAIDGIKDPEIKKLLNFSKGRLSEIKSSNEREENNQIYHTVSMALIHVIGKYDLGSKYNAYSCPMVKKKWVQNSKKLAKIHNPYAPNMPNCGSQDTQY